MSAPTDCWSLSVILYLQQWSPLPWLDSLMVFITLVGDPKNLFFYIAPLLYWLHHSYERDVRIGIDVLVGILLSDWLNAILKLPARGDRPYWYDQRVKEFTVTCESGWGMPSGHVMVSSCVAYILVSHTPLRLRSLARTVAVSVIAVIAVTRMYVGSHFIEQVCLGAIGGVSVAWFVVHNHLSKRLTKQLQMMAQQAAKGKANYWSAAVSYATAASAIFVTIPALEYFILSFWVDPLYSLTLAREGCEATKSAEAVKAFAASNAEDPVLFQLERGPMIGVIRDAGVVAGFLLAWSVIVAFRMEVHANHKPASSSSEMELVASSALLQQKQQQDAKQNHYPIISEPASDDEYDFTFLGLTARAWHQVAMFLIRGVAGLAFANLFFVCVTTFFKYADLSWLMPRVFIYAKNYLIFGSITFNYLVIVPIMLRIIERLVNRCCRIEDLYQQPKSATNTLATSHATDTGHILQTPSESTPFDQSDLDS